MSTATAGFRFVCPEAARLSGDGAALRCDRCALDVVDLSALTREEAAIAAADPAIRCVRLTVVDGRARFAPPRPVALLAGMLAVAAAGCAGPVCPAGPDGVTAGSVFTTTVTARLDALIDEAQRSACEAEAQARRTHRRPHRKPTRCDQRAAALRRAAQAEPHQHVLGGEKL